MMKIRVMSFVVFYALNFLFCTQEAFAQGQNGAPEFPVKVGVGFFQTGPDRFLVTHFENFPGWHTYWHNPGDAGLPTKVSFFQQGKELSLIEQERLAPKKYVEEGDLWAYGHEGAYSFFFKIPSEILATLEAPFVIKVSWLACKNICIPGHWEADLQFVNNQFRIVKSTPDNIPQIDLPQKEMQSRFALLPKDAPWPPYLDLTLHEGAKDKELILFLNFPRVYEIAPNYAGETLLIPFPNPLFSMGHSEWYRGKGPDLFGKTPIEWNGHYQEPPVTLPSNGQFAKALNFKFLFYPPTGEAPVIIEKKIEHFQRGQLKEMDSFYALLHKIPQVQHTASADVQKEAIESTPSEAGASAESEQSILWIILLAIFGGFILNFMPCVLPVISLKLFGLIKHSADSPTKLWRHNMAYVFGILISFVVLGLLAILLKFSGQTVGWGLQLQSPRFVAIMCILLFVLTLNLFGLFEFMVPGGKILGNVSFREGFIGDFLSGVLATILSTPCSAPFLGTAITFAFTRGPMEIIFIFIAVGIGFSVPFFITSIFPSSMKLLPKPGHWMEHLKKFLGLTLLLTVVWLLDVFQALTDGTFPTTKLTTTMTLTFFAFYFQKNISKKFRWRALIFIMPLLAFTHLMLWPNSTSSSTASSPDLLVEKQAHGLNWIPWSEAEMEKAKAQSENVFIDFTAQWCFTCKANEQFVIDTDAFKQLAADYKLKLLLGDWTKRDEVIGRWLLNHGAAGVPAYYVQKANGELKFLGETVTLDEIRKAIEP
ncbi:MAG: thioredoxin family protein [Bdellovibrio sp.]|nr:thioredoxin family protein [Bdellovibrio sp.]